MSVKMADITEELSWLGFYFSSIPQSTIWIPKIKEFILSGKQGHIPFFEVSY